MSKPIILFNEEELEYILTLGKTLTVQKIYENVYPLLSPMLIYKQHERAIELKYFSTKKLRSFLFPPWIKDEKNCIIYHKKYKDKIPETLHTTYKNIFIQPVEKWVLVGYNSMSSGRWYPKDTPRKLLK